MAEGKYIKIRGLFNLEIGIVEAFKAMGGTKHECKHLPHLLKRLDDIECFVADPGYLSRQNCRLAAEKGGTPYIKPKKNSRMKTKGCWPWKNMMALYRRHPRIFNRLYKLCQRIEAGWHSLKSLVGDLIRNKTIQTKKRKSGRKSSATTSYEQSEEAADFEPKPTGNVIS